MVTMSVVTRHLIDRGDGAAVELFLAQASGKTPNGAILFVHGNQGGSLLGAREFVDNDVLLRFSAGLNISAAAVSQPGFGASDGPSDFCGPKTQQAIMAALLFLRGLPSISPGRIVLYGNSRGAVASAMVATKILDLRAVILSSGVYDLEVAYHESRYGLRRVIEKEAGLSREDFLVRSALHFAAEIRSETMLLHGRHDDRAHVGQAESFSKALSDAGVPVTLHVFECGHQIPRSDTRTVVGPFLKRIFNPYVTYH